MADVRRIGMTLLAGSAWAAMMPAALSATGTPPPREAPAALEEVVVTAQKREEKLQETPVAVSAITTEVLEQRGIVDVGSLSAAAPNLTVMQTSLSSTSPAIYIRGIGEAEPLLTIDAPNALYVDGALIGRSTGAIFDLVDLERIEVLRGPQGTLYGRNTTGGAINLITKRPADGFGFDQRLEYGRFDLLQSRSSLDTGRLGRSGLRARLSYVHKQRDGYVDNTLAPDGGDPGAYRVDAARLAIAWDGGDGLQADYTFDYNKRTSRSVPAQLAVAYPYVVDYLATSAQLGGAPALISKRRLDTIALNADAGQLDRVTGDNLRIEAQVGGATLRSITSVREWWNPSQGGDLDGNGNIVGFQVSPAILAPPYDFVPIGVRPFGLYENVTERRQRQWSQELNLIGTLGERTDYVLGAFHFEERAREMERARVGIIIPTPPIDLGGGVSIPAVGTILPTLIDYRHESTSTALFGQSTYRIGDKASVTGGVRYTWDDKKLDLYSAGQPRVAASFGQLTWLAAARYQIDEDVSAYLRIATGYKAGGFNARTVAGAFDPEKVISYEIGLKSEWLERRVRANAAVFYTRYRDLQVAQFEAGTGGAQSVTVNAGKASYEGFELELAALLAQGFTLSANFGYTDRNFDQYLFRDPVTDAIVDLKDTVRFSYSAGTTAGASLEKTFGLGSAGRLVARTDYAYRGRVYFHPVDALAPFNRDISDPRMSTVDARLTWEGLRWGSADASLALWGRNLTNEDYLYSGVDFGSLGFAVTSHAEPRTWGIEARVRF